MDKQTEFDFSRASQLAIVENAALPELTRGTPERMRASASVCALVLRILNSYGSVIYPSLETIAAQANVRSTRTIKRALARLESLGVIIREKRRTPGGHVGNVYKIVWTELALLDRRRAEAKTADGELGAINGAKSVVPTTSNQPPQPIPNVPERGDMVSKRGDMVSKRGDMVSPAWGHGVPLTPNEPQENPHQPSPAKGAGDDLEIIGDMLREAGCRFWKPLAAEFAHLGVEVVRRAVATYEANRRRLDGPGAMVTLLRCGELPIEGAVDPEVVAASAAARRARAESAAVEAQRLEVEARAAAAAKSQRLAEWRRLPVADRAELLDEARRQNPMLARKGDDSVLLIELALELLPTS